MDDRDLMDDYREMCRLKAKISALEAENQNLKTKLADIRHIARYEANPSTDHFRVRQRIDEMITAYLDEKEGKEREDDDGNDD